MAEQLSYWVNVFSDKVRIMNQTNSKTLTLTSAEARNIQTDIFTLLAKIAALSTVERTLEQSTISNLDGGKFSNK